MKKKNIIGEKIKRLRKTNDMNQAELGRKIGADARQISNYENGKNTPSTDALIRIANVFKVSLDYLAKDEVDTMAAAPIRDKELLEQFEEVDRMTENEKEHIKFLIQSVIDKRKFKNLAEETA
jgi:transcriptional regulator with XRE-family HTH domain